MKFTIKKFNGLYWNANNDCFGPKQAATIYDEIDDLPDIISENEGEFEGVVDFEKVVHEFSPEFRSVDILYYAEHPRSGDFEPARVVIEGGE